MVTYDRSNRQFTSTFTNLGKIDDSKMSFQCHKLNMVGVLVDRFDSGCRLHVVSITLPNLVLPLRKTHSTCLKLLPLRENVSDVCLPNVS